MVLHRPVEPAHLSGTNNARSEFVICPSKSPFRRRLSESYMDVQQSAQGAAVVCFRLRDYNWRPYERTFAVGFAWVFSWAGTWICPRFQVHRRDSRSGDRRTPYWRPRSHLYELRRPTFRRCMRSRSRNRREGSERTNVHRIYGRFDASVQDMAIQAI